MNEPPLLPLVLLGTPPGLELALAQEGVPFVHARSARPVDVRRGRFVLFDGRTTPRASLQAAADPRSALLDIETLGRDDLESLVDTEAAQGVWTVGTRRLTERIHRRDRAATRDRVLGRLRRAIEARGGLWARLAPYPFPYRSAFAFRADLDEPDAGDYARYAVARRPIDDCSTHFVSTAAYGGDERVLADLRRVDTQSHGHFHHVYRDPDQNARNLERADRILRARGFRPAGFAAPGGRWNPGLDLALERLGYRYSSDFQLGADDIPFHPWLGDRFSTVLQVPIHPVCEGLFFEAGETDPGVIAAYFVAVLDRKIAAGEPAFLYGHPERRLGRHPEIVAGLAAAVARHETLWRVTLTEFARWWRWRSTRRWSVQEAAAGRLAVHFDDWSGTYPLALEIHRGDHHASVPLWEPRTVIKADGLGYLRRTHRVDAAQPAIGPGPRGLRSLVKAAIDWELVTPFHELPDRTLADRLKRGMRAWRERIKT